MMVLVSVLVLVAFLWIVLNLLSYFFSFLIPLLCSVSFLPAATPPGSLFGFALFLSIEVAF